MSKITATKTAVIDENYTGELITMSEVLYQFSTKIMVLTGSFKTDVLVYEDHIDIMREGRTVLPKESTVFFETASTITHGYHVRPYITFVVPGSQINSSQVVAALNPSQAMFATAVPQLPYNDPFSVVGATNEKVQFEEHFNAIKSIFDKYKGLHARRELSQPVAEQDGPIDKLKKLKELADLGIISDSEYEEKRRKLLDQI